MSTASEILKLLEENKGTALSGSDMALTLGVSRAAIWKAVNSLKENGYEIAGVNKKGYTLTVQSDILSPQSIMPYVKNHDFYKDIIVKKEVGSTNDEAKLLGHENAPNGTVVIAENQTNGKGRQGRSFFCSQSSSIYMSTLLRPKSTADQILSVTAAAAVAVCRAIHSVCGVDCKIKWVNDVYVGEKKICGILTEASMNFEMKTLDYLVVGIGINIKKLELPPELSDIVTSLEEHTDKPVSRSMLAGEVLNELCDIFCDLDNGKTDFIKEYKSLSFVLGCDIKIIHGDKTELAKAIDINEKGHLIAKKPNGEIVTLNSGEISVRKR